MRCWNPEIAGHFSFMKCSPEIESININGSTGTLSLKTYNGFPLISIEIKYTSMTISANIPETDISTGDETE